MNELELTPNEFKEAIERVKSEVQPNEHCVLLTIEFFDRLTHDWLQYYEALKSISWMLGWGNIPHQSYLEKEISDLKKKAGPVPTFSA